MEQGAEISCAGLPPCVHKLRDRQNGKQRYGAKLGGLPPSHRCPSPSHVAGNAADEELWHAVEVLTEDWTWHRADPRSCPAERTHTAPYIVG